MKNIFYIAIFILFIDLSFHQCANPGRPTGGPKDTIPPTLINSIPITGTTDFSSDEIILEFSEYINADKLQQQLIITPRTDLQYKSFIKKNKLYLRLESKLEDSTTYNFNFADGVTDITEKNPAINLSLAFSTGPYIDSLKISGEVQELLSQEAAANHVVGLYGYTDTLDFFKEKPLYFTTTNDSGKYNINYIKTGIYKILAFDDDNGNYLLDPDTESHGFLSDTISLNTSKELPTIRTLLQNVKPIELINARPAGPYVEIKFNKSPNVYSIKPKSLYHQITGDKKDVIRIYKPESINFRDSLLVNLTAADSLGNQINDTIKFVFLESNRKPAKFSFSNAPSKLDLRKNTHLTFNFSKPVKRFDSTKFSIQADSIFNYPLHGTFTWNHNWTSLKYKLEINPDSLYDSFEKSIPMDTAKIDTSASEGSNKLSSFQVARKPMLEFVIDNSSFISVENDSSAQTKIPLIESKQSPAGVLRLTINTTSPKYTLQLLNEKGKVAYSSPPQSSVTFPQINPGTYTIRVLIDDNQDGTWFYGNLLQDIEPETIYIHPDEISIRENWEVDMSITF